MKKNSIIIDGNIATAKAAYFFSEVVCIFPITPSSNASYQIQDFSNKENKNFSNAIPIVFQYQSEAGSISGIHGALQMGILATTFTSSQGLLLMIPGINKCKGQLLPAVIHVATRSIANVALSIFGDHQDIYSIRNIGTIMICSSNPQKCYYFALISHAIAISASYSVIHFYDGFRTSNEVRQVNIFSNKTMLKFLNLPKLEEFRKRGLSNKQPTIRGIHLDDQLYFQALESQNNHIDNMKGIVKKYFSQLSIETGLKYSPYIFHGSLNCEYLIICMGSVVETVKETIYDLNKNHNYNVGCIEIILYRPFLYNDFCKKIPKTVKKIAVLNKTKENGAVGEPLYVDVIAAINKTWKKYIFVSNGRYGLGGKNTSPADIKSVFDDLQKNNSKHDFVIGINDNLTNLSLDKDSDFNTKAEANNYCVEIIGLGGDGSITCGKIFFNLFLKNTKNYGQLFSIYNSLKSNNITRTSIRFNKTNEFGAYYPSKFNFIVCNLDSILNSINILKNIKNGGIFLLNTSLKTKKLISVLPNRVKILLAKKKCIFYTIDAYAIAEKNDIKNKISLIICFSMMYILRKEFKNIDIEKESKIMIKNLLSKIDSEIINKNLNSIKNISKSIKKIKILDSWNNIYYKVVNKKNNMYNFIESVESYTGDNLSTSKFVSELGFDLRSGTIDTNFSTFNNPNNFNQETPRWLPDKCIQCNKCVLVCPHATIRAFLVTPKEIKNAPERMKTLYAVGSDGYKFRIQVDNENCVGCGLCAKVCPTNALEMVPINEEKNKHRKLTKYLYKDIEQNRTGGISTNTYKGANFLYPYIEGSAACAGCGETPYIRLLTQLFGNKMIIANATGCSSIFGGNIKTPWTSNKKKEGPSWVNSLFEDNAEFGLGMALAQIYKNNYLTKNNENKSFWIIGGDGWAYDIGISGILHVLHSNININILILNTEGFGNTGGQDSSASPKFNNIIKNNFFSFRKDLVRILIGLGNVYVAQVSMGMNPNQVIKAFKEAESFNGPSVVVCYAPCISHKIKGGLVNHQISEREAVICGYWNILRYDPRRETENLNPLVIDFKMPNFELLSNFLRTEGRFVRIFKSDKYKFSKDVLNFQNYLKRRFETLIKISEIKFSKNKNNYKKIIKTMEWK